MKRAVRWLGFAVAILAGAYFLRHAVAAFGSVRASELSPARMAAAFAVMLPAYLLAVPLAALMWRRLLRAVDVAFTPAWAYGIVAFTQFGKSSGKRGPPRRAGGRCTPRGRRSPRLSLSVVYENLLNALAAAHLTVVLLVCGRSRARAVAASAWRPGCSLPRPSAQLRPAVVAASGLLGTAASRCPGCRAGVSRGCRHLLACYCIALCSFLVVASVSRRWRRSSRLASASRISPVRRIRGRVGDRLLVPVPPRDLASARACCSRWWATSCRPLTRS